MYPDLDFVPSSVLIDELLGRSDLGFVFLYTNRQLPNAQGQALVQLNCHREDTDILFTQICENFKSLAPKCQPGTQFDEAGNFLKLHT